MTTSKVWRCLTGLWAICVLSASLWNARTLPPAAAVSAAAGGVDEISCGFEWDDPWFEIWGTASCPTCGPISMEINFGDGSGWGSNQVDPGPTFFHQWYHLLPGPGSYQVCMEADDADGERCTACQLVTVYM